MKEPGKFSLIVGSIKRLLVQNDCPFKMRTVSFSLDLSATGCRTRVDGETNLPNMRVLL